VIAEIGHYSIVLALMLSVVQSTLPLIGAHRNDPTLMGVAVPAALGQFLFVLIAFCALTCAYIVSDFSIALITHNSHTLKPMLYKVSGVWGNHKGSMLLWILILALFGLMVSEFGRNALAAMRERAGAAGAAAGLRGPTRTDAGRAEHDRRRAPRDDPQYGRRPCRAPEGKPG